MVMRRPNVLMAAALAALVALAFPSGVSAQSTARLRGTLTDESGGAVPGATVLVRNQATGEERQIVSDKSGEYQAPALTPGVYSVEVRAPGFEVQLVKDVRLEVAQTVVQSFKLALGQLTEAVAVVAEAPVIESTTT